MKNLTITPTEKGLYLSAVSKGVRYGQAYLITDEVEALRLFKRLIKTYQTKGDLYVIVNGGDY